MRYFFDTEFIEDGKTIDLISIGIVAEDGRECYRESAEANLQKANPWVQQNVLPHLLGIGTSRQSIAEQLVVFCDPETYGPPEFWAYYADYDWIALCQVFGTMMDLPKGWPMYCRDLKQVQDMFGLKFPPDPVQEHYALADAHWNFEAWKSIRPYLDTRTDGQIAMRLVEVFPYAPRG